MVHNPYTVTYTPKKQYSNPFGHLEMMGEKHRSPGHAKAIHVATRCRDEQQQLRKYFLSGV